VRTYAYASIYFKNMFRQFLERAE